MKYAVIYQSKSGNTEKIAKEIYQSLDTGNKELFNLDWHMEIPEADVYFVGFGIYNGHCSMDVINCFEQISDKRLALFVTCGYTATVKYKENLERHLDVWMPEDADYLGMFLCQGRVAPDKQTILLNQTPEMEEEIIKMLDIGSSHPNQEDYCNADDFAKKCRQRQSIAGGYQFGNYWMKLINI